MRVITNLDPSTYDKVEELVETRGYRDIDQFIRTAVQNQISLEHEEISTLSADTKQPTTSDVVWSHEIPSNPPIGKPFDMDREDQLLFQQYYRFFPLVVVVAELADLTSNADGPVALSQFRSHMRDAVEEIRNPLREWEDENDVKKTERKSTGLPKTDVKNPDYSMKRFLDHYVGRVRQRDNRPLGFGNDLALISYRPLEDQSKCLVQLTRDGKQLLNLGNPLLANGPDSPTLSGEEKQFLTQQVHDVLPEEHSFITLIYRTLDNDSEETYTQYLEEFEKFLIESPGFSDDKPSEDRVRSMTGGALSRMVELGIMTRGRKRGVYIPQNHPDNIVEA